MEQTQIKIPFYAKISMVILGMLAFFYILFIGQDIIIPIVFAVIISIVLNPFVNFMCNKGIGKGLSILIALLVSIFFISALFYFIGSQLTGFSENFPQLKQKFSIMIKDMVDWIAQNFNISKWKINDWMNKTKSEGMKISTDLIGQTLGTISGVLIIVFLLPVYIFMILFYKSLLLEFISRLFKGNRHKIAEEVLFESKKLVQSYLVGLLLEALIVAILNSVSLFIIGIQYAILIGLIGALLNVIPYIGGLIAIAIPMLVAIATGEPIDAVWVFIAYMIVQFIDNNFIVPKVVASKVKVNALVSVIVVIVGGALWGISGMFLSIPLIAILKVVCDRIEPLKPFGFLLGDDQPEKGSVIFRFKK